MLVRRYISERQLSMELAADMLAFIRQRGLGKAKSKVVFSDIKAMARPWSGCQTMIEKFGSGSN